MIGDRMLTRRQATLTAMACLAHRTQLAFSQTTGESGRIDGIPVVDFEKRDAPRNAVDNIVWPEPIRDLPGTSSPAVFEGWWKDLSQLPILQSDLIVFGLVIRSRAHVMAKGNGIYSAFTVKPGIIFRQAISGNFHIDREMVCTRVGAAVRFPSRV